MSRFRALTSGLLGSSPYLVRDYRAELRLFPYSAHRVGAIALLLAGLLLVPVVSTSFTVHIINFVLIAVIGAVGLQIVTGMAGQLSLGHGGFLAIGAFTAAAIHLHLGLPFWAALPAAAVTGAVAGLITGLPAFRLRGLYLGITTLAAHFVVIVLGLRYQTYLQRTLGTGADIIVPVPSLGFVTLATVRAWYFFLLILAGATIVFTVNLRRSTIGREWSALRTHEVAAEALGVHVRKRKTQAFVISSVFGSVAGALVAYYFRSVNIESFGLIVSVQYLAMILIGGLGSVLGAVLGAAFVTMMPFAVSEVADLFGIRLARPRSVELAVFSLVTIIFLIVEPTGMAGIWRRVRAYFERWPYRYKDVQRTQR